MPLGDMPGAHPHHGQGIIGRVRQIERSKRMKASGRCRSCARYLKDMTMKYLHRLLLVGCLAFAAGGCSALQETGAYPAVVGQATYRSAQGATVRATYYANNTVRLRFDDGEVRVLPIAISGSGARYASACCEWWEHQGEATYALDGKAVFVGKISGMQ